MHAKHWSYREITMSAETSIRRSMTLAQKATDPDIRRFHITSAWGMFFGWSSLTMGWMADGDRERLEQLTVFNLKARL